MRPLALLAVAAAAAAPTSVYRAGVADWVEKT